MLGVAKLTSLKDRLGIGYEHLLDGGLHLSGSLPQHFRTSRHRAKMHQLQTFALYLFNHHAENLLLLSFLFGQEHQSCAVLSLFRYGNAL